MYKHVKVFVPGNKWKSRRNSACACVCVTSEHHDIVHQLKDLSREFGDGLGDSSSRYPRGATEPHDGNRISRPDGSDDSELELGVTLAGLWNRRDHDPTVLNGWPLFDFPAERTLNIRTRR
jgi:hypothetical protein